MGVEHARGWRVDVPLAADAGDRVRFSRQFERRAIMDDFAGSGPTRFDREVNIGPRNETRAEADRQGSESSLGFGLRPLSHPPIDQRVRLNGIKKSVKTAGENWQDQVSAERRDELAKVFVSNSGHVVERGPAIKQRVGKCHLPARNLWLWIIVDRDVKPGGEEPMRHRRPDIP